MPGIPPNNPNKAFRFTMRNFYRPFEIVHVGYGANLDIAFNNAALKKQFSLPPDSSIEYKTELTNYNQFFAGALIDQPTGELKMLFIRPGGEKKIITNFFVPMSLITNPATGEVDISTLNPIATAALLVDDAGNNDYVLVSAKVTK